MALTLEPLQDGEPELVARARAGQAEAREELAGRCRRAAYLFALQLLGNPDDALDVTQEAMLRFLHSLPRFDPARPVRPWLLTIVRNQARDLWRRRRLRRADSLDGPAADLSRRIADPRAADPELEAGRRQLCDRVWRALSSLPTAAREILVLRDYHDLSYAEIAAVLGVPRGTVMSRLHRARRQLREIVAADGDLLALSGRGARR